MPERFPQLVERFGPDTALMTGCNSCGYVERILDAEAFMAIVDSGSCPACGEFAGYGAAFDEGIACQNCGELDYTQPVGGCCSRACALQHEYAEQLKAQQEVT